jgi:hypothetical protein
MIRQIIPYIIVKELNNLKINAENIRNHIICSELDWKYNGLEQKVQKVLEELFVVW